MSVVETTRGPGFLDLLDERRSVRQLTPAPVTEAFIQDLETTVGLVPSAFNTQPWRVILLLDQHDAFWTHVNGAIQERLEDDRRERYLARSSAMRPGGITILIFEDLGASDSTVDLTFDAQRDYASQSLGMLQLALWLTVTAHGLATSLQHWQEFMEDIALDLAGLSTGRFRLVTFMPVGRAIDPPQERQPGESRLSIDSWPGVDR